MTQDEVLVRQELTKVYPQLKINMRKVCGDNHWRWADDLLSVAVTFFLEKPIEQQLKTIREGKLENFITFIANIQLKSNSSLYTAVYRKPMSRSRELFIEHVDYSDDTKPFNEDLFECINDNLKLIPQEYHDALLGISLEGESESKFVKKLGLTTIQFRKQMKEYVTLIQNKCEHCL